MHEPEKRAEPRVPVCFRGVLTVDGTSMPCEIQNMCSRGFLIKRTTELPVGQVLHLKCELYPSQPVECTVQVRHVNARSLGARVIDMNEDDKRLCQRFLDEQRTALARQ